MWDYTTDKVLSSNRSRSFILYPARFSRLRLKLVLLQRMRESVLAPSSMNHLEQQDLFGRGKWATKNSWFRRLTEVVVHVINSSTSKRCDAEDVPCTT